MIAARYRLIAVRYRSLFFPGGDGERIYRVDRIDGIEVAEEADTFSKPHDFDVKSIMDLQPWEAGSDPHVEAEVRFDAEVAWWAARTLGLPEPKGELVALVPVANRDAFIGWILSFGASAEVLAPPEIRESIRAGVEAAVGGVT